MGLGWEYPPGTEHDPRAPWNQHEPTCEVCGQVEADCKGHSPTDDDLED